MGKYSGYLICTDIDGTLLNKKAKLSIKNRFAIRYFVRKGGMFTVASGRWPDFIGKFGVKINVPIIGLNGTMIYDSISNKVVRGITLADDWKQVLEFSQKFSPQRINICYENRSYKTLSENDITEAMKTDEKVYKALFEFSTVKEAEDFENECKKNYGDKYTFNRSWPKGVEILSDDGTKGCAVKFLKEYLKAETLICAGDFENDISMIEEADIGYAVENALEEVKKAADRIAPDNNHSSIARIIKDINKG